MQCDCCKDLVQFHEAVYPKDSDKPLCKSCYALYVDNVLGERIVLVVKGEGDDWAAYAGRPEQPKWVTAAYGIKLTEEAARKIFPSIKLEYRK